MTASIPVFLRKTCVFFVLWSYFALLLLAFFTPLIVAMVALIFATAAFIFISYKADRWEKHVERANRYDEKLPAYLTYALEVFCHYYRKPIPTIAIHRTGLVFAALKAVGFTKFELILSEPFLKTLKREEQLAILERTIISFAPARLKIYTERTKWEAVFSHMTKRLMDRVQLLGLFFFYPLARILLSFLVVDPKKILFQPAPYSPEALAQRRAKLENERGLAKHQLYEWKEFILWPAPTPKKEVDPEFIPWLISSFRQLKTNRGK